MRDLASRLRNIVRQDAERRARDDGGARPRTLTYVADGAGDYDAGQVAERLGGRLVHVGNSTCLSIDAQWDDSLSHGRRRISSYRPAADAPLALFDPRAAGTPDWARHPVFFDVETTGLSGGAGTLAFLVGCGWFDDDGFRVRQFLLAGPAGERAMLDAIGKIFDEASLLVTYNGRTFDVPLMETRWAFHRSSAATDDLPHFDMLPPARRLWGRPRSARLEAAEYEERESCSLSSLERTVLGFHRLDDVPGIEIPSRYFQFLRTGQAEVIEGVLDHNRHDLLSLAAVMSHALWLAQEGPCACRESRERVGLGRLYERAGAIDRATEAYEMAASEGDRDTRSHALARLAVLLRRDGRHDQAAAAWQGVIETSGREAAGTPLARRAAEALAIHHEHRARDLATARRYAASLERNATGQHRNDVRHRLDRLDRKLKRSGGSDGQTAGLNWDEET
jgi:uncharacterized protein YprB with RNaseH-like and TPR domain